MIDAITGVLFFGVPLSLGLLGYGAVRLHEVQTPPPADPPVPQMGSPSGVTFATGNGPPVTLTAQAHAVIYGSDFFSVPVPGAFRKRARPENTISGGEEPMRGAPELIVPGGRVAQARDTGDDRGGTTG
jgi:hypothetical protein